MLDLTVRCWLPVTMIAGVGFVVAVVYLLSAGRSFLPDFNEGSLTISAVTIPGTALAESDGLGRMVEEILLNQPEVVATARRTGRARSLRRRVGGDRGYAGSSAAGTANGGLVKVSGEGVLTLRRVG